MKKTLADYQYSDDLMARIYSCAYLYAASTPAVTAYANANCVCVGKAAVDYVIGAVHRLMSFNYADNFMQGLEIVEASQVQDQTWRRGKVIDELNEEMIADDSQGFDAHDVSRVLIGWFNAQSPVCKHRIMEIAHSEGKLTRELAASARYLLKTSDFNGRISTKDLVYLIRTYLG
jgi:hypothetical protein